MVKQYTCTGNASGLKLPTTDSCWEIVLLANKWWSTGNKPSLQTLTKYRNIFFKLDMYRVWYSSPVDSMYRCVPKFF